MRFLFFLALNFFVLKGLALYLLFLKSATTELEKMFIKL